MPVPKIVVSAALMAANMALTMTRTTEGPRLDDLKFTGGDYGGPLPMVWGLRRLQCPIIWAEDLNEVKRRRKTKGGKYNEYTYYGTWAVALAGHEISAVRRIWFDTHLVYDLSGAGPVTPFDFGDVGIIDDFVTIYTGSETQDPDPRMQATVEAEFGEGSCPAYRGTAYVVFKDIPLEKIGNRIPQVSVELSSGDSFPADVMSGATGTNITFSKDYATAFMGNYANGISLVDVATRTVIATRDWGVTVSDNTDHFAFLESGEVLTGNPTGGVQSATSALSGEVRTLSSVFTTFGGGSNYSATDADGNEYWMFEANHASSANVLINGESTPAPDIFGYNAIPDSLFADADGDVWLIAKDASDATRVLFYSVISEDVVTAEGISTASLSFPLLGFAASDGNFVLFAQSKIYRIDRDTGATLASVTPTSTSSLNADGIAAIMPGAETFWVGFQEINSDDLTTVRTLDYRDWVGGSTQHTDTVYDPINHALIVPASYRWCYLDRVGTDTVTLETIANDVAGWCAVDSYDFSDLDQAVTGWSATRGPANNILEPLLDAYDADIRPHDFTIEGLKRTGVATGATLATADFTGEPRYSVTVKQAAELPRAVLIDFADTDAEQQPNTVRADRPLATSDARSEKKIDLSPLALDTDTARQLGNRYHRRVWNERSEPGMSLSAQELALEPGDVRALELDGEEMDARCVKTVIGADDRIATEWRYDAPTLATLDGTTGATFDGRNDSSLVVPVLTRGFVLDIPLVEDADEASVPQLYTAAAPYTSGTWPGATIYQSVDGEYTDELAAIPSSASATWGTVAEALAYNNPNLWDRGTEITVTLATGTLAGISEATANADPTRNLAAIGADGRWEIVQFTNATLTSGTTYTVSGFKRGRRGTEWAAELHAANDVFVLLDTAEPQAMGLSEVGTDLSFKAVSGGRTTAGAFPIGVAFTGAAMKPYAPAHLSAVKESNGDWTIDAVRRTRVGGAWTTNNTTALGEDSESYSITLGDGATEVTKTTSSLPYTWTQAAQVSDMGSEVTAGSLEYAIAQVSADVGAGYASEATA